MNTKWTTNLVNFKTTISADFSTEHPEYYQISYEFDKNISEKAKRKETEELKQRTIKPEELNEFIERFKNTAYTFIQNHSETPVEDAIKELAKLGYEEKTLRSEIERKVLPNLRNDKALKTWINAYYNKK